jgi:hypothetical protein
VTSPSSSLTLFPVYFVCDHSGSTRAHDRDSKQRSAHDERMVVIINGELVADNDPRAVEYKRRQGGAGAGGASGMPRMPPQQVRNEPLMCPLLRGARAVAVLVRPLRVSGLHACLLSLSRQLVAWVTSCRALISSAHSLLP